MKIDFEFGLLHVWATILVADLKKPDNNRFRITKVVDYEGNELTTFNGKFTDELMDQIEKFIEAMLPAIVKGEEISKPMTELEYLEAGRINAGMIASRVKPDTHQFGMTHNEREDAEIGLTLFSSGIYF